MIAGLEKAAKSANPTGTLHQVLRKMAVLVSSTRQATAIEPQVFQDVQEAFLRFSEDTSAPVPAILTEALEWMQAFFVARGFARPGDESAATPPPAPAGGAAPRLVGKKDSFESSSASRARALTGEVPVPPAVPVRPSVPEKQQQQDLESFKTWMKNPALGKLKG